MNLTIHIGAHKSGSTAIQTFACTATNELKSVKLLYPIDLFPAYPKQHSELTKLLGSDSKAALSGLIDRVATLANKSSARHVLLSGEDLCVVSDPNQIERLATTAKKYFSDIRIVLVLRRKQEYLISHYNHFLRHSPGTVGVEDFVRWLAFRPDRTINLWRGVFGEENVTLVPYSTADGRGLVERFYQGLFQLTPSVEMLARCQRVNQSFDLLSAFLFNDVLKARENFDIGKINVAFLQTVGRVQSRLPAFEHDLTRTLDASFDDDGWEPAEISAAAPSCEPLDAGTADLFLRAFAAFLERLLADDGAPGGELITRNDILAAYRLLLDRVPENEAVIERALSYRTRARLRAAILSSAEFANKNPLPETQFAKAPLGPKDR